MGNNHVLDGFTMYRNTSTRPFVTVTKRLITFSKLALQDLGFAEYVHVYFNDKTRCFAIQACEKDADAVPLTREGSTNARSTARWGDKSIIGPIIAMLDPTVLEDGGVRIVGQTYPDEHLIVFDAHDISQTSRKTS